MQDPNPFRTVDVHFRVLCNKDPGSIDSPQDIIDILTSSLDGEFVFAGHTCNAVSINPITMASLLLEAGCSPGLFELEDPVAKLVDGAYQPADKPGCVVVASEDLNAMLRQFGLDHAAKFKEKPSGSES